MNDILSDEPRLVGADRVLAVLVELAGHPGGVALDELAAALKAPKSSVHRALVSLRRARLATQLGRGTYALSDEFLRLAFTNHAARPDAVGVEPVLTRLVERFGETAHYAVLDGLNVVYRAKVDPPSGAVRLTSVVGGLNPAHRTAVGKLLLGYSVSTPKALAEMYRGIALEGRTPNTITDVPLLWEEIRTARESRFATDNQENELGVNCIAVPWYADGHGLPVGAISVSALAFRLPITELVAHVDAIREIIDAERM